MDCLKVLEQLAYDHTSSSFNIALKMLDCSIELWEKCDVKPTVENIMLNQPSMAVVINIAGEILKAENKSQLEQLRQELLRAENSACKEAFDLLSGYSYIATISYSNTVLCTLRKIRPKRVFIGVGHPAREGEAFARELIVLGIDVVVFEDAAYSLVSKDVDAFLIGADAVFDDCVVNKIGSFYLALLANYFGKPFYVVANRFKYLSGSLKRFYKISNMDAGEVSNLDCQVLNVYFEKVPMRLVTKVIGV